MPPPTTIWNNNWIPHLTHSLTWSFNMSFFVVAVRSLYTLPDTELGYPVPHKPHASAHNKYKIVCCRFSSGANTKQHYWCCCWCYSTEYYSDFIVCAIIVLHRDHISLSPRPVRLPTSHSTLHLHSTHACAVWLLLLLSLRLLCTPCMHSAPFIAALL